MSENFLWWAEDYFSDDRLNTLVEKDKAFEDYKSVLSRAAADMSTPHKFKRKLLDFCLYKDWKLNPEELLQTATEKSRNEIRRKENGQVKVYFYIDTTHSESLPVNLILGEADTIGVEGETPIFGE